MTVLDQLASSLGRQDDVPNQELARKLAQSRDVDSIQILAKNLWNKKSAVQSDCLKTLYEIGYLSPDLIAPYAEDFLKLILNRNNRLVWGAMIALSTIAPLAADTLFAHRQSIEKVIEAGSVITVDAGIKTLAQVAASKQEYNHELFPYLLQHLQICRSKDVPQHCEQIFAAVTPANREEFFKVLEVRLPALTPAGAKRVQKVIKAAAKL
jgi:hypothetical protein